MVKHTVTHVWQSRPNTCWAACSEMVSEKLSGAKESQFMSTRETRFPGDLGEIGDPKQTIVLLNLLNAASKIIFSLHPHTAALVGPGQARCPHFTWPQIKKILDCGPIIVAHGAHNVVICGYGDHTKAFLWVHDPLREHHPQGMEPPVKWSWVKFNESAQWRATIMTQFAEFWALRNGDQVLRYLVEASKP